MEYELSPIKIPKLGFGTYGLKGQSALSAVKHALSIGLNHIDTAVIYGNEAEVGSAIKESSLKREKVFLTTKVWRDSLTEKKIKASLKESLERLKVDYIDLFLIHWPNPDIPLKESLGTLMQLQKEGLIKHIGVSNFTCSLLQNAKKICPQIITNQVEYHPLLSQKNLLRLIREQNILLTAYAPLIRGKVCSIQQIARIAKKYKKNPCQIALKWLTCQKNVIAIFKSSQKKRIEENLNIFDFQLKDEDIKQINHLNNNKQRLIDPPFAPKWDY